MIRRFDAPVWVAVSAPLLALLVSVAVTSAVIQAGWLDAVCEGALHGYMADSAAEAVEVFWCDLRGSGYSALRHVG